MKTKQTSWNKRVLFLVVLLAMGVSGGIPLLKLWQQPNPDELNVAPPNPMAEICADLSDTQGMEAICTEKSGAETANNTTAASTETEIVTIPEVEVNNPETVLNSEAIENSVEIPDPAAEVENMVVLPEVPNPLEGLPEPESNATNMWLLVPIFVNITLFVWVSVYSIISRRSRQRLGVVVWLRTEESLFNAVAPSVLFIAILGLGIFAGYGFPRFSPSSTSPIMANNTSGIVPESSAQTLDNESIVEVQATAAVIDENNLQIVNPIVLVNHPTEFYPSIQGITGTVGQAGGVLQDSSNLLRLEFGAGAVNESVTVSMQPSSFSPSIALPVGYIPVMNPINITALNSAGTAITYFAPLLVEEEVSISDDLGERSIILTDAIPRVRLEFPASNEPDSLLNPANPASHNNMAFYFNEEEQRWIAMVAPYDPNANAFVVETDHFTTFAFLNDSSAGDKTRIVIDPAHGGADSGGHVDYPPSYAALEKDFTLAIALQTEQLIETCSVDVLLTRSDDSSLSRAQRVNTINWYAPAMSYTIAVNIVNPFMSYYETGSGYEIWIDDRGSNRALGDELMAQGTTATGLPARSVHQAPDWYRQPYEIADGIPFAHVEGGFMDQFHDRGILDSAPQLFAFGYYNGMRGFMGQLGINIEDCAEIPPSPLRDVFAKLYGRPPWLPSTNGVIDGDPVNLITGSFTYQQIDLSVEGPLELVIERTYNGLDSFSAGSMGAQWSSNLDSFLYLNENGEVDWKAPDGRVVIFSPDGENAYSTSADAWVSLYPPTVAASYGGAADEYALIDRNQTRYFFRRFGQTGIAQLQRIARPSGANIQFSYTDEGALSNLIDSGGRVYPVTVDEDGRIIEIHTPAGGSIEYHYEDGLLVEVVGLDGRTMRYVYEDARLAQVIDPNGNTVVRNFYDSENRVDYQETSTGRIDYNYDPSSHTSRMVDEAGVETVLVYDDLLRPVRIITPTGETQYSYDENWNVVREQRADGSVIERSFNTAGDMLSKTYPDGQQYEFVYNAFGLVESQTNAVGETTRFVYDERQNLREIHYPDGRITRISYNDLGQVTRIDYHDGTSISNTYDSAGNLIAETNQLGQTVHYSHNALGRISSITSHEGHVTSFTYNHSGQIIEMRLANGAVYRYEYDANGNLSQLINPLGQSWTYTYTGLNQLSGITDPLGGVEHFEYNVVGDLIRYTDQLGRVTSYEYRSDGYLAAMIDPAGQRTSYTRDALGRLLSIQDVEGGISYNRYDASGRLVEGVDPMGYSVSWQYDELDRLILATNARGGITRYIYEANTGNLIRIEEEGGGVRHLTYDSMGYLLSVTHPDSGVERFGRDATGRITSHTDARNYTEHYSFDGDGNLTEIRDRRGNTTSFQYDGLGNVLEAAHVSGAVERFEYDVLGQLIAVTDSDGNRSEMVWDALGRLVQTSDPYSYSTIYRYNPVGNLLEIQDALGFVQHFSYNELNRLVLSTNPEGESTSFGYTPMGNIASITLPNGATNSFAYDANQRLIRATDPLGYVQEFFYDENSNLIRFVDKDGSSIENSYDLRDRLIESIDKKDNSSSFSYDSMDNLIAVTDANGNDRYFSYDLNQNLIKQTTAEGIETHFEYNENNLLSTIVDGEGNRSSMAYHSDNSLAALTDARGGVIRYEYSLAGDLLRVINQEGESSSYSYDKRHLLSSMSDGEGNSWHYEYDALGRLTHIIQPNAGEVSMTYDAVGRLLSREDAEGGIYHYEYSAVGEITYVIDPNGNETQFEYSLRGEVLERQDALENSESYRYDELGRLISYTDKAGFITGYERDAFGDVIAITDALGGVQRFSRDNLGNILSSTSPEGRTISYTYDKDSRLLSMSLPEGQITQYSYDKNNRLLTVRNAEDEVTTYAYNEANLLVSVTNGAGDTESYSYDLASRLSSFTDGNGHQRLYQYDDAGRLVEVEEADGSTTSYVYDSMGMVIEIHYADTSSSFMKYDLNSRLLVERDQIGSEWHFAYDFSGNLTSRVDALGQSTLYTWDALNRLSRIDYSDGTNIRYSYDARDLLTAVHDQHGQTVAQYDALGRLIATETSQRTLNETIRYEYNADSDLIAVVYPNERLSYSYDANGWLLSLNYSDGLAVVYGRDDVGRVRSIAYPNHTQSLMIYDDAGRVLSIEVTLEDGNIISLRHYAYDGASNVISQAEIQDEITNERAFVYDAQNRLIFSSNNGENIQYVYSAVGNILKRNTLKTDGTTESVDYRYNAAGCLLQMGETLYLCDANGNRAQMLVPVEDNVVLLVNYDYSIENELIRVSADYQNLAELGEGAWLGVSYPQTSSPDDAIYETTVDTLLVQGLPNDALAGQGYWTRWTRDIEVTQAGHYTFNFAYNYGLALEIDGEQFYYEQATGSQLSEENLEIHLTPGSHTITVLHGMVLGADGQVSLNISKEARGGRYSGFWLEYDYDGLSRMVEARITIQPGNGAARHTVTESFSHLGWSWDVLRTAIDYRGNRPIEYYNQYWAAGHMVGQGILKNPSPIRRQYLYNDMLGNVIGISDSIANGDAIHAEGFYYGDYGVYAGEGTQPGQSNILSSRYLWGGHYYENLSGLSHYGSRWLDTSSSRWMTKDAYHGSYSNPGTLQRFNYVLSNPLSAADHYGYWCILVCGDGNGGIKVGFEGFGQEATVGYNKNSGVTATGKYDVGFSKGSGTANANIQGGKLKYQASGEANINLGGNTYGVRGAAKGEVGYQDGGLYWDHQHKVQATRNGQVIYDQEADWRVSTNRGLERFNFKQADHALEPPPPPREYFKDKFGNILEREGLREQNDFDKLFNDIKSKNDKGRQDVEKFVETVKDNVNKAKTWVEDRAKDVGNYLKDNWKKLAVNIVTGAVCAAGIAASAVTVGASIALCAVTGAVNSYLEQSIEANKVLGFGEVDWVDVGVGTAFGAIDGITGNLTKGSSNFIRDRAIDFVSGASQETIEQVTDDKDGVNIAQVVQSGITDTVVGGIADEIGDRIGGLFNSGNTPSSVPDNIGQQLPLFPEGEQLSLFEDVPSIIYPLPASSLPEPELSIDISPDQLPLFPDGQLSLFPE